jgi:molybdate transport system permease protein
VPGAESEVARLAIISVLLSVAALLASELLVRRSHGRRAHVL